MIKVSKYRRRITMKYCANCGAELMDDAKKCPNCGKRQKNIFVTVLVWIVAVIVAFYLIGAIFEATDMTDKDEGTGESNTVKISTEETKTEVPEETETQTETENSEPQTEENTEQNDAGESQSLAGTVIPFTQTNYNTGNMTTGEMQILDCYLSCDDYGEKIIMLKVHFTNTGKEELSVSSAEFSMYGDNCLLNAKYSYGDGLGGEITPGREAEGEIAFYVNPDDYTLLELEFARKPLVLKSEMVNVFAGDPRNQHPEIGQFIGKTYECAGKASLIFNTDGTITYWWYEDDYKQAVSDFDYTDATLFLCTEPQTTVFYWDETTQSWMDETSNEYILKQ